MSCVWHDYCCSYQTTTPPHTPGTVLPKGSQMGSQAADFLHAWIFLWDENIMFSKPSTKTKIGRAMGFCWFLDFDRAPLKALSLLLYVRVCQKSIFLSNQFSQVSNGCEYITGCTKKNFRIYEQKSR